MPHELLEEMNGIRPIGVGVGWWEFDTCPIQEDSVNYLRLRQIIMKRVRKPIAYCTYKLLGFVHFDGIPEGAPSGMGASDRVPVRLRQNEPYKTIERAV